MRARRWTVLAIVAGIGLAGCEAGADDAELDTELETAEPATEEVSTPAPAGSMTMTEWDQDQDQQLAREEFDRWYGERNLHDEWNAGEEGLEQEELSQGLFETWDIDDDAGLTEDEWSQGIAWFGDDDYGSWGEWDANGDSVLDANEVAEGLERENLYDRVDRDSDALIDDEELADWWFDLWDADDNEVIDTTEWDQVGTEYSRVGWSGGTVGM